MTQCFCVFSAVSTSCQHSSSGDGRRHLRSGVLTGLHRRDADRHVPAPGRRGEDQVEVFFGAHALEVAVAAGVAGGFRDGRRPPSTVARGLPFSGTMSHTARISTPSIFRKLRTWAEPMPPTADEADSHLVQWRCGEEIARGRAKPASRRGAAGQTDPAQGGTQAGDGTQLQKIAAIGLGRIVHGLMSSQLAAVVHLVRCTDIEHHTARDAGWQRAKVPAPRGGAQSQRARWSPRWSSWPPALAAGLAD